MTPLIKCEHVDFGYDNQDAVVDVDMEVNPGDYLCIVGENGSGKSTLMKGLLGLLKPTAGRLTVSDELKGSGIGYLPQQTAAQKDFPATVLEVVLSGCLSRRGWKPFYSRVEKEIAGTNMEKLGITPDRIDELQTISYEELTAASHEALIQTGEEMQIPAALGEGYSLSWEPVVDGDFLPTDPVTEDSFAEAGRDIPLLIGSNLNEWETVELMSNQAETQYDNKTTWTEEETRQHLEEKYGDQTDAVVDAFLAAYPHRTAADALYVDSTVIRLPMLKIMSHKADQGGAPVYAYMFNWESPVLPGTIMAFHTSEIPFVFNNIDKAVMQIGGGEDARRIENAMSQAWINFARTGDPSTEEMEWPAYTREGGATMIFDTIQEVVYNHDKELMSLLAPDYEY